MFELSCASQTPCREQQRVHDAFANHGRYLVRAGLLDGDPELFDRSLWSWLHGAASLHSMGLCPDDDLDRLVVETACNVASLNGNRIKTSNIASVACSALAVEHYPLPPRLADVLCG
jgi:hypothetical protein